MKLLLPALALGLLLTPLSGRADMILGDNNIPFDSIRNPVTSAQTQTATFQISTPGTLEEVDVTLGDMTVAEPIEVLLTQNGTTYGEWSLEPILPGAVTFYFLTPSESIVSPADPYFQANEDIQLTVSTTNPSPGDYSWLTNAEGNFAFKFRWFPGSDPTNPTAASSRAVPESTELPLLAFGVLGLSARRVRQRRRSS